MRGNTRQRRRVPAGGDIAAFRHAPSWRSGELLGRPLRIGLLVPQSGPIGLFGPSSLTCSMLAADELNAEGGILGRPVELIPGDGGGSYREVVAEAERMIAEDGVDADRAHEETDARHEKRIEARSGRYLSHQKETEQHQRRIFGRAEAQRELRERRFMKIISLAPEVL